MVTTVLMYRNMQYLVALLFTKLITKLDTQLQDGLCTNSYGILYSLMFTNQINCDKYMVTTAPMYRDIQ